MQRVQVFSDWCQLESHHENWAYEGQIDIPFRSKAEQIYTSNDTATFYFVNRERRGAKDMQSERRKHLEFWKRWSRSSPCQEFAHQNYSADAAKENILPARAVCSGRHPWESKQHKDEDLQCMKVIIQLIFSI